MQNAANCPFIKGLKLGALFYEEAVRPILATHFSAVTYSAALLGPGSDVLGFDTPQSMDHDWGPRLMLFLTKADHEHYQDEIGHILRQELARKVRGYSIDFDLHEDGTTVMRRNADGPVNHRVVVHTIRAFSVTI